MTVGDDVVRYLCQSEPHKGWRLPHSSVADIVPCDGVFIHVLPTFLGAGIETEADDLQTTDAFLFFQRFELTLDALLLVLDLNISHWLHKPLLCEMFNHLIVSLD